MDLVASFDAIEDDDDPEAAVQKDAAIMAAAKTLDRVTTVGKSEIPKNADGLIRELLAAQRQTLSVSEIQFRSKLILMCFISRRWARSMPILARLLVLSIESTTPSARCWLSCRLRALLSVQSVQSGQSVQFRGWEEKEECEEGCAFQEG